MNEIRMRSVPEELHQKVKKILIFECKTSPEYIKPMINDILDEYPDEVKNGTISNNSKKQFRLRCVSPTKYQQLENIAKSTGVTIEQLLKVHLKKVVDNYPINL